MNSSVLSKKELIKARIKEKAVNKKISCSVLRRVAKELKASYKEVGEVADELGVKIKNCELGCF